MGVNKTVRFFVLGLVKRFMADDVSALAAETTYYLILGLVPFMIFLVNAILFFMAPQLSFVMKLLTYLPSDFAVALEGYVYRIIAGRSTVWLTLGLVAALWSGAQGIDVVIRSTDKAISNDRNKQSWISVKAKSLLFTLLIVFAMILSLGVTVFGNAVVYALDFYFTLPDVFLHTWNLVKYALPFFTLVLSLSIFYRYATHSYRTKWVRAAVASVFVTAVWLLLTGGYSYYILNLSTMGLTYGSLIGLVVLFIWFHLAAMVIIMGSEFIATWKDYDRLLHPTLKHQEL
jgi:membrane protein